MFIPLLILIFIRPLISSLAFAYENNIYTCLLLGLAGFWIIFRGLALNKAHSIRIPLLLFLLVLFSSFFLSRSNSLKLDELSKYTAGFLLFLFPLSFSGQERKRVILAIYSCAVLISLLAIYQYFFGFQHLLKYVLKEKITNPFVLDAIAGKRVFYPFITPNILAGYLAMVIPLGLIYKNRFWLIFPLTALILTKSIGVILAIFLVAIVYFYLQGRFKSAKFAFFLLGSLVCLGLIILIRASVQKEYLQPSFSGLMRLSYWRDTLQIIKAHPFWGIGPGNFNLLHSRYTHNSYLQLWAETGMLGLVGFLWLSGKIIILSLKSLKEKTEHKHLVICLLCSVLAFLLHNGIDFTFFLPEVSLIWWVILGLLYSSSKT